MCIRDSSSGDESRAACRCAGRCWCCAAVPLSASDQGMYVVRGRRRRINVESMVENHVGNARRCPVRCPSMETYRYKINGKRSAEPGIIVCCGHTGDSYGRIIYVNSEPHCLRRLDFAHASWLWELQRRATPDMNFYGQRTDTCGFTNHHASASLSVNAARRVDTESVLPGQFCQNICLAALHSSPPAM